MNVQVTQLAGDGERMCGVSLGTSLALYVNELIASFPGPTQLSPAEGRGIIARYGVVLEANFIYWMTACYLAAKSDIARAIARENLLEEVRDCHPEMLRKFVRAAGADRNDSHLRAVESNLSQVRQHVSRLSPTALFAMMAFFEMFIQRFMPILAELAAQQGSEEQEYTRVHGTCDIIHSQELVRALEAEIATEVAARDAYGDLFDGVDLLRALIRDIVFGSDVCEIGP
jgi:hypothetical protein